MNPDCPQRNSISRRGARVPRGEPAASHSRQVQARAASVARRLPGLAEDSLQEGLGGGQLAGRVRRHGLDTDGALHLGGGACAGRCATLHSFRHEHGRSRHLHLRHGGTKAAFPARHTRERRLVVPGVLRAERRLGPRFAEDFGLARRHALRGERHQDLDDARPVCRLDLLPGAHGRARGKEPARDQFPAHRHAQPGHTRVTDHHDRWSARSERSALRQRARAG